MNSNCLEELETLNDFVKYCDEHYLKIQECYEKTTRLRCEVSKLLLRTTSLFTPEILVELHSLESTGQKCDSIIMQSQDLIKSLDKDLEIFRNNSLQYKTILKDLEAHHRNQVNE